MSKKKCKECGVEFQGQKTSTKFCSKPCAGKAKRTSYKKRCKGCNKTFVTKPSANSKFCSKNCVNQNAKGRLKVNRIEKCCEFCGNKFKITPSKEQIRIKTLGVGARFCSSKCVGAFKSAQFKHPPVNRKCEHCKKDFTVEKPCKKNRFCSNECFYKDVKVKKHKERSSIIPLMKKYRLTHNVEETAKEFGISSSCVNQWGVLGPEAEKRLSCPDQLNNEQQQIILGNLLGDGSIGYVKKNQNSSFKISQKAEFLEYVKSLHETYLPFSCNIY